jgi:hypothetical protein
MPSLLRPSTAFLLLFPTLLLARPISPYLVGQNLWNGLVQNQGADRLWGALRDGGFGVVRIGGIHYEENMPGTETYLRMVDSIKSIGAEPLVQVSTLETPQHAADLVRALNLTHRRNVKFWSIGNEPTCGKAAGAAEVAAIAASIRARASAMKAVDPSIRIAVGEECYWRPELYDPLLGGAQDVAGRDAAGRTYADIVAFHSYPFPGADKNRPYTRQEVLERAAPTLRGFLSSCAARIALANARHSRTGAEAMTCAITEFNVTYWNVGTNTARGVGSRSFLNGQFMAEVAGEGAKQGAFTVLPWSIYEGDGRGGGSDLGQFDGPDPFVPRPSHHHLRLSAQALRGEYLDAVEDDPLVRAYAARQGDTLSLLLLHLAESSTRRIAVGLDGQSPAGAALPIRVAAGIPSAHEDTLGPQETLLLRFHRTGALVARIRYGVGQAEANQPPRRQEYPLAADRGLAGSASGRAWPGALASRPEGLRGDLPAGKDWVARWIAPDGRIVGETVTSGGPWLLPWPENPGVHALVLRGAASAWTKILVTP